VGEGVAALAGGGGEGGPGGVHVHAVERRRRQPQPARLGPVARVVDQHLPTRPPPAARARAGGRREGGLRGGLGGGEEEAAGGVHVEVEALVGPGLARQPVHHVPRAAHVPAEDLVAGGGVGGVRWKKRGGGRGGEALRGA
jgi:hypothetical protein